MQMVGWDLVRIILEWYNGNIPKVENYLKGLQYLALFGMILNLINDNCNLIKSALL